jgi:hypothetical protein
MKPSRSTEATNWKRITEMTNDLLHHADVERIQADHSSVKRLGRWTEAGSFEVRGRSGSIVLDLRSPALPREIDVELRLERAMVKLLLPDDAVVEHWDLEWTGRGKIKDGQRPAPSSEDADGRHDGGIRVRLRGSAHQSEVRVNRGGMAQLAAICSREFFEDARRAHQAGTFPTVDDPTRISVPGGKA